MSASEELRPSSTAEVATVHVESRHGTGIQNPSEHAGFLNPARFSSRVGAFLIDTVVIGLVGFTLVFVVATRSEPQQSGERTLSAIELFNGVREDTPLTFAERLERARAQEIVDQNVNADSRPEGDGTFAALFVGVGLIVGPWLYFAGSESSAAQATLGKRVVGIVVTDLNGKRLTFAHATARWLVKWISGLVTFGLGHLMAVSTPRGQALHDLVAGTLIVERRGPRSA